MAAALSAPALSRQPGVKFKHLSLELLDACLMPGLLAAKVTNQRPGVAVDRPLALALGVPRVWLATACRIGPDGHRAHPQTHRCRRRRSRLAVIFPRLVVLPRLERLLSVFNLNLLRLGSGTNELNANTINLGGGGRSLASLDFNGLAGTVKIRGLDAVGRSTMNVSNGSFNTGAIPTGTVDFVTITV